jgi:hypothetical protein
MGDREKILAALGEKPLKMVAVIEMRMKGPKGNG